MIIKIRNHLPLKEHKNKRGPISLHSPQLSLTPPRNDFSSIALTYTGFFSTKA